MQQLQLKDGLQYDAEGGLAKDHTFSRFFWNPSLNNCIEVHTKKAFLTLSLLAMATIFTNMVFQMAKYGFPHGQIYSQI